ncbi:hypothetical protein TRVL_07545 [Trypanosoma vivax]|nr:hypothetical protein TRVL_07545 [Trypanosoma vivax]
MCRQALLHAAQCRDSHALKTCACVLPPRFAPVRRAVTRPCYLLRAQHVVLVVSRLCAVVAAVWLLTRRWSRLGGVPLLLMSAVEYATAQLCACVFARHCCNILRISL